MLSCPDAAAVSADRTDPVVTERMISAGVREYYLGLSNDDCVALASVRLAEARSAVPTSEVRHHRPRRLRFAQPTLWSQEFSP
jgi:hypothetical protein